MTIACNFAYVRTETLNFMFTRQGIVVYFYVPTSEKSLYQIWNINVLANYF